MQLSTSMTGLRPVPLENTILSLELQSFGSGCMLVVVDQTAENGSTADVASLLIVAWTRRQQLTQVDAVTGGMLGNTR